MARDMHRTDRLLEAWASRQRLDQHEATRMLEAIVEPAQPPLSASWWTNLSAQVSSAVVMASVRPELAIMRGGGDRLVPATA